MEEGPSVSSFKEVSAVPQPPPLTTSQPPKTPNFAFQPFLLSRPSFLAVLGVGETVGFFFFFAIYQQIVWS